LIIEKIIEYRLYCNTFNVTEEFQKGCYNSVYESQTSYGIGIALVKFLPHVIIVLLKLKPGKIFTAASFSFIMYSGGSKVGPAGARAPAV